MQGRWKAPSAPSGRVTAIALIAALALVGPWVGRAAATLKYGDIQISGNIEVQNLVRIRDQFKLYPVQQRNTLRLQYEHELVKGGKLLGGEFSIPFIDKADFFAYYRGVYDSIYDIAPGGRLRTQDGGVATRISDFPGRVRLDIGTENVLREIFLDLVKSPVSLRIGRQQIVWGNTLTPGVMDTVNTVDASWHASQESGLLGRVGFSELRIPFWAVKVLYSIGSVGPLSNAFIEAYDSPFQFSPTDTRQLPAPWSLPFLNPFRGGLVVDLGAADGNGGIPPGLLRVQPCFDTTGNPAPNGTAHTPDSIFADTATTGLCNSTGLQKSRALQGLYDKSDPWDVNQFGARFGATAPFGLDFTLNYVYRRASGADIIDSLPVKAQVGAVNSNPTGFVRVEPHATTDPVFNTTTDTLGYLRVPVEFYYPYIHTMGGTFAYFEEFTEVVYNLELAYRKGVTIATLDGTGNGLNKKDVISAQLLLDRQTWIRSLNQRSTFTTLLQTTVVWLPDHQGVKVNPTTGVAIDGDVGIPNSALVPKALGELDRIDKLKEFEWFMLLAMTNFYRGGTVVPLVAVISDMGNAPSLEFLGLLDLYPTNNFIIELQGRLITNFGRNVDEPFGIGRYSQYDEVGLKLTYQF